MHVEKVISSLKNIFFVGILNITDEKSRIRKSVIRIRGSGSVSVPKCHGTTKLVKGDVRNLHHMARIAHNSCTQRYTVTTQLYRKRCGALLLTVYLL
jgi:hypothetical protein